MSPVTIRRQRQHLLEAPARLGIVPLLEPVLANSFGGRGILRVQFEHGGPFAQGVLGLLEAEITLAQMESRQGVLRVGFQNQLKLGEGVGGVLFQEGQEGALIKLKLREAVLGVGPGVLDFAAWFRREVTERLKLRQGFGRQSGGSRARGGSVTGEHLRQFVLEFRRHRSVYVQQIHLFAQVAFEVVEFCLRRLNVFVFPHAQGAQRRPTESVVSVEAFAVDGARRGGFPGLERAQLAYALERGGGGYAQVIQNRRRHVDQPSGSFYTIGERQSSKVETRKSKI